MIDVLAYAIVPIAAIALLWAWAWKYIALRRIARSVSAMDRMLERLDGEYTGLSTEDKQATRMAAFFAAMAPRACVLFAADTFTPTDLWPAFSLGFGEDKATQVDTQADTESDPWMSAASDHPTGDIPEWLREHVGREFKYALYTWVYANPFSVFRWLVVVNLMNAASHQLDIASYAAAQFRRIGGHRSWVKTA